MLSQRSCILVFEDALHSTLTVNLFSFFHFKQGESRRS
jgi:hypothetical protein